MADESRGVAELSAVTRLAVEDEHPGNGEHENTGGHAGGVVNKNLLRQWRLARRQGNLSACRQVYAAVVDTAEPAVASEFKRQLDEVTETARRAMRASFAAHVREAEYKEALEIGQEITTLFASEPIAAEFKQIKPHLLRKAAIHPEPDPSTTAATH
jgi:transposase-like protein